MGYDVSRGPNETVVTAFDSIDLVGLGSKVYRWLDANADKVFQPGEGGALPSTTGEALRTRGS